MSYMHKKLLCIIPYKNLCFMIIKFGMIYLNLNIVCFVTIMVLLTFCWSLKDAYSNFMSTYLALLT